MYCSGETEPGGPRPWLRISSCQRHPTLTTACPTRLLSPTARVVADKLHEKLYKVEQDAAIAGGEPIIPLQVPWGVWMALSLLLTRVLLSWLAVLLPLGCLVTPPEHIIICVLHYKLEQRTFSSKGKFIITKLYYLTQSQIIIAEKLEVFYSMKIIAMQEKKMKNF